MIDLFIHSFCLLATYMCLPCKISSAYDRRVMDVLLISTIAPDLFDCEGALALDKLKSTQAIPGLIVSSHHSNDVNGHLCFQVMVCRERWDGLFKAEALNSAAFHTGDVDGDGGGAPVPTAEASVASSMSNSLSFKVVRKKGKWKKGR